jgi:ATP-dependent Clp protease ATP-binding subunit ClpC
VATNPRRLAFAYDAPGAGGCWRRGGVGPGAGAGGLGEVTVPVRCELLAGAGLEAIAARDARWATRGDARRATGTRRAGDPAPALPGRAVVAVATGVAATSEPAFAAGCGARARIDADGQALPRLRAPLAAGVAVAPITLPHLGAFGPISTAPAATSPSCCAGLLAHGELHDERAFFADARLRRVPMVLRCLQGRRLLEVPMKFSALTFTSAHPRTPPDRGGGRSAAGAGAAPRARRTDRGPERSRRLPRGDHPPRPAPGPASKLMDVAYAGEESLETMIVPVPPSSVRPRAPAAGPRGDDHPAAGAGRGQPAPRPAGARRRWSAPTSATRSWPASSSTWGRGCAPACCWWARPGWARPASCTSWRRALGREGKERLEIYTTSAGRIVAGMRYLGEWQERLGRMVAELRERRAVLHFESLAELCHARSRGDDASIWSASCCPPSRPATSP